MSSKKVNIDKYTCDICGKTTYEELPNQWKRLDGDKHICLGCYKSLHTAANFIPGGLSATHSFTYITAELIAILQDLDAIRDRVIAVLRDKKKTGEGQ